jgi:hypothetical protein
MQKGRSPVPSIANCERSNRAKRLVPTSEVSSLGWPEGASLQRFGFKRETDCSPSTDPLDQSVSRTRGFSIRGIRCWTGERSLSRAVRASYSVANPRNTNRLGSGKNRYPIPHTVSRCRSFVGSSSIYCSRSTQNCLSLACRSPPSASTPPQGSTSAKRRSHPVETRLATPEAGREAVLPKLKSTCHSDTRAQGARRNLLSDLLFMLGDTAETSPLRAAPLPSPATRNSRRICKSALRSRLSCVIFRQERPAAIAARLPG